MKVAMFYRRLIANWAIGFFIVTSIISDTTAANLSSNQTVEMFPLTSVRLLDGYFKDAMEANHSYLMPLKPDRLLAPFMREAGLPPKAESYGNWESIGLDGHTAGHYLSALSLMIASGNDSDGEFSRRLDYMLDELERCQKVNGDGYIGGVPGSRELWNGIASGNIRAMRGKWAPWYNVHKTFAGLRDAYQEAGKQKARDLLVNLGNWCVDITSNLSDEQMQQMLNTEYGGMNEVMADIYAITGDEKYLTAAKRFNHHAIIDPLIQQEDRLTSLHANTQIPKITGLERIAALTGNAEEHAGARFFWETVTQNRSVVFGGNSVSEHFNPTDDYSGMIKSRQGPETCNTYNMLRLTRQLFSAEPRAVYADFYERALYNHILSTININNPGFVYFTPIRPDLYRTYSQPEESFWCCVGTGMENPGKYGEFIYARDRDGIFVNLFIPSELTVNEGFIVRQETRFPYESSTRLSLKPDNPTTFTLRLRHPFWVSAGQFAIKINGTPFQVDSQPSSYVEIRQEWKNGDIVEVSLPMHTSVERLPDASDWVAIMYGPVVLAKPDSVENMDGLFADDGLQAQTANGPMIPLDQVPVLLTTQEELSAHIVPDSSAGPMHFRLMDVVEPLDSEGMPLVPFFSLHEQRYQMYWELSTSEKVAAKKEKLAEEERARAAREAATIDQVSVGEQQPEVEHGFKGEETETGITEGRRWRQGTMMQYTLDTHGEEAVDLEVTYWGGDNGRTFDIMANDTRIATQELMNENPGEFITKRYPITDKIIEASSDGLVTITFVATRRLAGAVYDVRLTKADR